MFLSLTQGSTIYILDKTDGIKLSLGTIISISSPRPQYNTLLNVLNSQVIDIKCLVDGIVLEYNNVPGSYSIINYNNGKITISESKLSILLEVEGLLNNSKLIVDNIDMYRLNVSTCEDILKLLNPLFAKDKERDLRIDTLENKIDKLLELINNK